MRQLQKNQKIILLVVGALLLFTFLFPHYALYVPTENGACLRRIAYIGIHSIFERQPIGYNYGYQETLPDIDYRFTYFQIIVIVLLGLIAISASKKDDGGRI
ncbi:MAG: hypothetical protein AB1690_12570 [Candidatus Zixiibacteriota bacterium]